MARRGRHPHNKLTEVVIRQALPGRHADGNGLYLFVRSTLSRHFVQRLVIQGKRHDLGLGPFPLRRLVDARRDALDNLRIARAGGDPRQKKGLTFRCLYDIATATRRPGWKRESTEANWRRGLEKYVLPEIGTKPVAEVTVEDLRKILLPLWKGPHSAGATLRQNLEYVFRTAVTEKHRPDNPAADLKWLLPKVRRVQPHMASLPYTEVREAMAEWQALSINPAIQLALLFIVLTGARLSEATDATWSEIDRPKRVWTITARRMKMLRGHHVRLSWQALEVLVAAAQLKRGDSLIFNICGSNANGVARPPSQRTMADSLSKLGRVDDEGRRITVHGFRTTFRTWQMECEPGFSEAAEIALAHEESNTTKKAYARSQLDEQRATLMQTWADYVLPNGLGAG